jgi:hypothetical protein
MFTLSDITAIGTKKHMATALYTKVADLLEEEKKVFTLNGEYTTTLGDELFLVTNPDLDGFRFAIDEADYMAVYEANDVEFTIYPTFYDSHVGMRLAIEHLVLMGEVPEYKGKEILDSLSKEQLDKLAEAMAWLNETYAKGL